MTARDWLAAALKAALADLPCPVGDAPPAGRATVPFLAIEEPAIADWSAAGIDGREARVTLTIHDAGERPDRARGLIEAAEAQLAALAPADAAWRLAGAHPVRSRVLRGTGERWRGTSEWVVRFYRAGTGGDA